MQEGSTQGRSALVFQALLLLSAVFALDLRGSYKVGELRAHTLMATCVGEWSGTVPPLLRGANRNFTGVPFLPVESCHHGIVITIFICCICKYLKLLPTKISVTAAQDTKRHIKLGTNSQPYRLSFPSEECVSGQLNTTHFQGHQQACRSACHASSPFTHFYSLSRQH